MTKDSVKNLKNIHNRASKKNIIATFALDILMATADTYVAVSQFLVHPSQLVANSQFMGKGCFGDGRINPNDLYEPVLY